MEHDAERPRTGDESDAGLRTDHKKRPIFLIRIPRTGTTSIRQGLAACGAVESSARDLDRANMPDFVSAGHATPDELLTRNWLGPEELARWQSLVILRNPWDRLVSTFSLFHQRGGPGLKAIAKRYGPTFPDYVAWATNGHAATGYHERNFQARPQTEWLRLGDQPLGIGLNLRIYKFDELPRAWSHVTSWLGVEGPLPHVNSSAHEDYREYFTRPLERQVAFFYAEEIERFGFRF